MEPRMSILFFGKKTRIESDKLLPIYLRVTINGKRFEVSAQRCVEPARWSSVAGKVKGNSEDARSINHHLDGLKQKVYDYQKAITQEGKNFTNETLRLKSHGIEQHAHTLVQIFRQHNDQLQSLIGKDNSKAPYTKYRTTWTCYILPAMEI